MTGLSLKAALHLPVGRGTAKTFWVPIVYCSDVPQPKCNILSFIRDNFFSPAGLTSSVQNRNALNSLRRRLFEETRNLAAVTPVSSYNPPAAAVPSIGSGSFPAIPNSKIGSQKKQPPMPTAPEDPPANSAKPGSGPIDQTNSVHHDSLSRRLAERPYIFILPAVALLLILSAVLILMCRKKEAPTIGPWRTGLSGQLKKAFITGKIYFIFCSIKVCKFIYTSIIY